MGVKLYVGGHASSIAGERVVLAGSHCFSPVHSPPAALAPVANRVQGLLDSGTFSDSPARRLSPAEALDRQLAWEARAGCRWGVSGWRAEAIVSYDLLIDEHWIAGTGPERLWSQRRSEQAVDETVGAAGYLASWRSRLAPRRLVLTCQGIDAVQYEECARRVLAYAQPGDVLGLGGWCTLGRRTSLLIEFWHTAWAVLPLARAAGLRRCHLFGVIYLPAVGGLLWLCDRLGVALSVDSSAPLLSVTRSDPLKAGVRATPKPGSGEPAWLANVTWWQRTLGRLRTSRHYRKPPQVPLARQLRMLLGLGGEG